MARELGLVEQTLRNWVKAAEPGKLNGAGQQGGHAGADGTVAAAGGERPAQAMECEILKKATAYFAKDAL